MKQQARRTDFRFAALAFVMYWSLETLWKLSVGDEVMAGHLAGLCEAHDVENRRSHVGKNTISTFAFLSEVT